MSEITFVKGKAIAAKQTQITQIQSDIEALQRAATVLRVHLILDNSSTHTTPAVKTWLERHSRYHVHFTPTSASWLNAGKGTPAKVIPGRPKAKRKRRKMAAAAKSSGRPKTTQKRKTTWSAADREAISGKGKRMKAYWAKRRRAKRSGG